MNIQLRDIQEKDRGTVTEMMNVFYHSAAVLTDGSEEIYKRDIDACLDDRMPLHGYLIVDADEEKLLGYTMLAQAFSSEFAMPCLWIEDLYILEEFREQKIGSRVLGMIAAANPDHILRLEVEDYNARAKHTYEKNGFEVIPYCEMIRLKGR